MIRDALPPARRLGSPVLHQHWSHDPRLRPAIYVLRDGRDVVVSLFFHNLRLSQSRWLGARRLQRFLATTLGEDYRSVDPRLLLPKFIRSLDVDPFGGTLRHRRRTDFLTWPDHVSGWTAGEGVCVVRYEDLLTDPVLQLRRITEYLNVDVDTAQLREIQSVHSFQSQTGRAPGSEDRGSFYRKGIAGDWRNWFTGVAAEAFQDFAGSTLINQGYEPDARWVSATPRGVKV